MLNLEDLEGKQKINLPENVFSSYFIKKKNRAYIFNYKAIFISVAALKAVSVGEI